MGINYCNATPILNMIISPQNIICNNIVSIGKGGLLALPAEGCIMITSILSKCRAQFHSVTGLPESVKCCFRKCRFSAELEKLEKTGRPRFGSVRLRFGGGTVRAVPVFGSGGSSTNFFCVSIQFNRKGRFRFRFLENGSGGSGSAFGSWEKTVPTVPVRFLSHPEMPLQR